MDHLGRAFRGGLEAKLLEQLQHRAVLGQHFRNQFLETCVVACAKGIMLSNVQFFLKVLDDNTISREFPGMEGMEVTYHRCQI